MAEQLTERVQELLDGVGRIEVRTKGDEQASFWLATAHLLHLRIADAPEGEVVSVTRDGDSYQVTVKTTQPVGFDKSVLLVTD